jgi:N-acetylmuramoyl-L-alanine amidase
MKLYLFLLISFLFVNLIYSQTSERLTIVTSSGTKYIPVYERQGIIYFSLVHFAEAISVNYYYNEETHKIELKFDEYNLKVTAKNPFVVITSRENNESESYQLPTSTYFIDEQIFVPLIYLIDYITKASRDKITYESKNKIVFKGKVITGDETKTSYGITGIIVEEKINGSLVRVKSRKRISTYTSSYKNNILTIIFRNVKTETVGLTRSYNKGLVKEINARNVGNDTEIKFTLGNEYTTNEVLNAEGSNDILITIHNKIFARNEERQKNRLKWNFDVVVIDAGHGGKDAGAVGVNGIKEKDVNLGVALKLGELIEKEMKDVKVVYTRKSDTFVELYKRGKIANEKDGKLFISIHCNSTPRKPSGAEGFEIYLLRPGRTKEAISIAERENSVIEYEENPERYEKLTDENFILVTMAHSAYMRYSEKFSDILNRQMNVDLPVSSRGVKQAGFYVLVGASMPSVLIETGFLSNEKDASYLGTAKGQTNFANAVYKAIKSFREYYEKVMQTEL